ncbi:hypothetical protein F5883DRAFT_681775 [Diaporthe sp. PMI_573]|nr:hypothetical protein F5883DRAFT_681775 [Diaporthaceae sp. PMI_573]
MRESGPGYASSTHWLAILDSITELREHVAFDDPGPTPVQQQHDGLTVFDLHTRSPPRPMLLYGCRVQPSFSSILKAVPARPIVDRLVSRYFNDLDMATAKSAECLILGNYTEGGPHVLETLILYFMSEIFPLKEVEVGIWMLVGTIVQVAMHMGLHRDPAHFPKSITPFAGEMRRRVWSMVVQIDFSTSTQLGLPRLVSQANTAEPRNLFDSDFDESTAELPPSRPETEVTPILYTLAKLRILSIGIRISDLITEPRRYTYSEDGISFSLTATPLVLIQRIWLNMGIQRLKVILHKRSLALSSSEQQQYAYSRSTCLTAAINILEIQHLVDEKTRPDGRLYQIRWRRHSAEDSELALHDRIQQRLQRSLDIWLRLSADSTGARRAAEVLRYVLRATGPLALESAISACSPAPLDLNGRIELLAF